MSIASLSASYTSFSYTSLYVQVQVQTGQV